jgi:phosphoribosyl-ATP pyrophosphohydrolase/phosphoribosyl-AMP cyclohydrolase
MLTTDYGDLLESLDFTKGDGLVTVATQHAISGVLLMLAHASRSAVEHTLITGEMHYHSRSRGPWHKGATSGHTQRVLSLAHDCDGDAILARVVPAGPSCHSGQESCFGPQALIADSFAQLSSTIRQRRAHGTPNESYTAVLLNDRNRRLKKLGEEAAELIAACADGDAERATAEAADLVYHVAVALEALGSSLEAVRNTLADRQCLPP